MCYVGNDRAANSLTDENMSVFVFVEIDRADRLANESLSVLVRINNGNGSKGHDLEPREEGS